MTEPSATAVEPHPVEELQEPTRSRWYVSSAPPRQRLTVIVVETIASLVALAIVAALTASPTTRG